MWALTSQIIALSSAQCLRRRNFDDMASSGADYVSGQGGVQLIQLLDALTCATGWPPFKSFECKLRRGCRRSAGPTRAGGGRIKTPLPSWIKQLDLLDQCELQVLREFGEILGRLGLLSAI
jgi:hypothetical protein